ncbi:hypothetical protein D3C80_1143320 [compost metagenome]
MRYISKQFLSPCAHETGSMVCLIETPRIKDMYGGYSGVVSPDMEATVTFRACYGEPVKLELGCNSQKDFEKRLAKVSLMIQELEGMRRQMTEMWYSHLRDVEFKKKELEDGEK